jgi:hypothetical protein
MKKLIILAALLVAACGGNVSPGPKEETANEAFCRRLDECADLTHVSRNQCVDTLNEQGLPDLCGECMSSLSCEELDDFTNGVHDQQYFCPDICK